MSHFFNICIDDKTIHQLQKGDLLALERIYILFSRPAYTLAMRILNNREMAEDVVQESLLKAFNAAPSYRKEAPFAAWFRQIVSRQALLCLRKQSRWTDLELIPEIGVTTEHAIGMDLEHAYQLLAPVQRAVLWFYDVEGYSHQEIANLFDKTISFSKSQLSRARKDLRTLLNDKEVSYQETQQ
ncbi:MAG: RNA polymerase sigma factor [bacterium]